MKIQTVYLMNIISAEKWMHNLYTVVDGEKCNELR